MSSDNKNPTIALINGANWLGAKIVETLIENHGNVIVIDDFYESNIPFIKRFADNKRFLFIERDKLPQVRDNFTNIKYIIHLKNDFDTKDDDISSKQFLKETKFTDEVLTLALEKNSIYTLVSSLHLHKDFVLRKNFVRNDRNAYTESDLQDYIERTVLEYSAKAGLNARIARLGNIYGPEMDLTKDPLLRQVLSDAIYRDDIRVYGDGLEYMYYVYITDAIQGIFQALFATNTSGQVYSITNPDEISVLSLVNKILGFHPHAKRIKFLKEKGNSNPLYEKAYIPDPNLSEIGWNPKISFDRGLAILFDYFRKDLSLEQYSGVASSTNNNTKVNEANIQFDFDNTLNLTNSFYGYNNAEGKQFEEFYQKLNRSDSPLYNLNNKGNYDPKNALSSFNASESKHSGFIKKVFQSVLIIVLIAFLVIPTVRLVLLGINVKSNTDKLIEYTAKSDYGSEIAADNFETTFDDSILNIKWAINLGIGSETSNNYKYAMSGLDQSIEIYNQIHEESLNNVIFSTDAISERDFAKLNNILLGINSAESNLAYFDKIELTSDIENNIVKVRAWLKDLKTKITEKTSTSN
jgi:dTDP-glucose 4,6-dehydratase